VSALRTALAGLLLGALAASLLQACGTDDSCGGGEPVTCAEPRLLPFRATTYGEEAPPFGTDAGPDADLRFSLEATRARAVERFVRDGRTVETEYEVVGIETVRADRLGP
jgi:hypothetical protein